METIKLPNDQVLNLPDDLDPQLRAQIAADVKRDFGIDINQTTVLGRAAEVPKGIARGAIGLAADVPLGIASLFDVGDDGKIVKGLQAFKKKVREDSPIAADPAYQDLWTTKLSEGIGSFVPFLGAGLAGRALATQPARLFSKQYFKSPEFTLPLSLAVPTGVAQQADRVQMAREMGEEVGPIAETVSELIGGAIGISEVFPIGALLARTSKTALKDFAIRQKLQSALIQGTQEGAQEVFASLAQDLTARGLYSDELPIGESLLDEFTIGGVIGAGADLVVNSFAGRRGIANENFRQREEQLRSNRIELQQNLRFQKAIDQGVVEEVVPLQTKEKPEIPIPIAEIEPLPNFEIIQDTQGNFSLLDTSKPDSPVLNTFDKEADAIVAKDKELNKLRVQNLKIEVENSLYNQGLINSSSAFDIGIILTDPNSISLNPQTILNFDSKLKKQNKKDIEQYFNKKKIEIKPTYSMSEARNILSPKDFKNLQSDFAQQIFAQSEKRGEPSIRDDKSLVRVDNKYIKELAESKNIQLDFNDPAVQYFTEQITGYNNISKVKNRGAKELFVARIHSLPKFNFKTPMPDFRPRQYSAEDMANFVANAAANDIRFNEADLLKAGPTAGNVEATKQFIKDLKVSGRAIPIENTNTFRINQNYEFEVARKAEGFNETPEEFEARLTRDGVLPAETIQQLVEAEKTRQEKFLPPKEVAPKIINFAQAVEEGKTNKFARETKKILNKAGLKETGVIISDEILSTTSLVQTPEGVIRRDPRKTAIAEGEYDRDTDIIFVSLNAVNPDGQATDAQIQQRINRIIDHELIHALRAKDLINEKEYQYLRQEVKRRKVPESVDATAFNRKETYYDRSKRINTQVEESQRGIDYKEEIYVEEAIAELYRNRYSKPDVPPKAKGIFDKIAQFFKSMGQAFRRSGFNKASEIFTAIEEGDVGARQRGEIRTLREVDRIPFEDELRPIVEIDETRETSTTDIVEDAEDGTISTVVRTSTNSYYRDLTPKPEKGVLVRGKVGSSIEDIDTLYDVRKLTSEEKAADKELILREFAGKDSIQVAEWLSKNGPSKDYQLIADRIHKQLKKFKEKTGFDFKFYFYGGTGDARPGYDRRYWGRKRRRVLGVSMYPQPEYDDGKSFRIYINNTATNGVDFNTILHELVHSATQAGTTFAKYKSRSSFDKTNLVKGTEQLERIRAKLIKEIRKKRKAGEGVDFYTEYGTKNIDELLAVGFTDREFQQFMESIEIAPKKNLWQNFVNAIRTILGLPAKAGTVFSEFLKEGARYLQFTTQEVNQIGDFFKRSGLALEPLSTPVRPEAQDTPLFSRVRVKDQLEEQINKLDTQIYDKENTLIQDSPYIRQSTYNRLADEINKLKQQRNNLAEQLANLPPEQLPLFSRAATDTSPAYMDLSREDISTFVGFDEYRFKGEKIPNAFVMRLPIDTFLNLTTESSQEINRIKKEVKKEFGKFDPAKVDDRTYPIFLNIDNTGKVISHEGRHRATLLQQEGAQTIPVVVAIKEQPNITELKDVINNPVDIGINTLSNQYDTGFETPFLLDSFVGPIAMVRRFNVDDIDYALQVANAPDTQIQDAPLFSRAQDISKRFEPYDDDIPSFSRAQIKIEPIRRQDKILFEPEEVDSISEFTQGSRIPYNKKLKTIPLDLVNKYPKLRELSLKNLRKLLNKNGNLVVYRSLNLSENEEIINNGQLPDDPFASTTLDSKYAQTIGKKIAVQNVIDTKLINKLYKDNKISESDYKTLTQQSFGMFDNIDKDTVINRLRNEGIELVNKFERPINVLRYEIPLDRVILHLPIIPNIIANDLKDVADYISAQQAQISEPNIDDYITDGMTEEEIEDAQIEYDDDLFSYESNIDTTISEIEDGFSSMEEESEVVANLDGITPTYIYKPASGELEFTDTFRRGKRYAKESNTSENKKLIEATEKAEEIVKSTPNGEIPTINPNASDIAIKAFFDVNDTSDTSTLPDDIPNFSVGVIPEEYQDTVSKIGAVEPTKSAGARFIDVVSDPISNIKNSFKFFRAQFIDKLALPEKNVLRLAEENDEVRRLENSVVTSAIASFRMTDRSRGLFQGLLTRGYVSDSIQDEQALANINDLEISTVYNPYIDGDVGTGGLIQIFSPLYADPSINREYLFKLYAVAKRAKNLKEGGREVDTPLSRQEAIDNIRSIEQNYPSVVEVYNNYQRWNNKLISFAQKKGLLSDEQAALWKEHSSYYPFYKKMVDDELAGPSIGGGALPNNPLSIQLKGSESPLDVNPIEAIARNSLSILTAALKNDGTGKLLRNFEIAGEAEKLTAPKDIKAASANRIFVFENGEKSFYRVNDIEAFYGLQSIGGVGTDIVTRILAMPATLLRDTVTRDPGFVVVNVLRDTLSAAVTSGVPIGADGFIPIKNSFQNLFADMEELEKFGVLGGYDFQNDEGSVKQFIDRAMRKEGLTPDNAMKAEDLFFKIWDGLGALTTKSDGATRLAVYNSVYNELKKRGKSEAVAQSEAAYQALEIINFGRRGLSPLFRTITAAIPFLNARIQGLDVLFRAGTGKYSAIEKLQEGETRDDIKKRIIKTAFFRGGLLMALTAIYYALVSDDEEYRNLRREVRDDNWIIPLADGLPALKLPIPFEVGMIFKTFPERFIDQFMGRQIELDPLTSVTRQLGTSAKLPFFDGGLGFQLLKPFAEAYQNRNTFTNTEIVPYYQQKLESGLQSRQSTNELLRVVGETFNISPAKLEHLFRGYTGTLGGYVLDVADAVTRGITGTPLIPPNLNSIPVLRRLLQDIDRSGGGLQQQFYELRAEVNTAVQTLNKLRTDKRFDEYSAYRSNMQGVFNIKGQVRALERYMDNWRKRRDRLLKRTDISAVAKSDLLKQLELERDRRLALVPELRKKANIPVFGGV